MKFIITESKLTSFIFDYLNGLDLHMVEYGDSFLFFESDSSGPILISVYRGRYDGFISSDLVSDVSSLFSLGMNVSLEIIGKWVNTKIDFTVEEFYSDYGSD